MVTLQLSRGGGERGVMRNKVLIFFSCGEGGSQSVFLFIRFTTNSPGSTCWDCLRLCQACFFPSPDIQHCGESYNLICLLSVFQNFTDFTFLLSSLLPSFIDELGFFLLSLSYPVGRLGGARVKALFSPPPWARLSLPLVFLTEVAHSRPCQDWCGHLDRKLAKSGLFSLFYNFRALLSLWWAGLPYIRQG